MHWRSLLALVLLGMVPALGTAAPPWSPPAPLGTIAGVATGSGSIAPLADGEMIAALVDAATPGDDVELVTLGATGVGTRVPLQPAGRAPRVASDPAGASVVVWVGPDGLYAVLRGADGELSTPRRILAVPPDREVRRFDVATAGRTVGGGLRAVVVAITDNGALYAQGGSTGQVAAVRLDSGAWTDPVTLATGLTNPVAVDVAATAFGGAAAVWADAGQGVSGRVDAARMTSSGTWRDLARIGSRTALSVAVAAAETGGSTIAWVQRGPGPARLLTRTRGAIGRYGDAVQVATGQIGQVALGSDAAGNVTMAWAKRTDTQTRLQTATRAPGTPWSTVGVLAVTPDSIPSVALTVNHRSDAVAGWTAFGGAGVANHFARYRRGGGIFGARERTAPAGDGRNAGAPALSLTGTGEAGAVLQLGAGNCCGTIAGTVRAAATAPAVSELRLSSNRLVGRRTLGVRFRSSRAGTVVLTLRSSPRAAAALVRVVPTRAGVNLITIDGGTTQLRPGRYTLAVGPTGHASDPGVATRLLTRLR